MRGRAWGMMCVGDALLEGMLYLVDLRGIWRWVGTGIGAGAGAGIRALHGVWDVGSLLIPSCEVLDACAYWSGRLYSR